MNADRQFIDVKERKVTIELPQEFVNCRVEVIALKTEEAPSGKPKRRSPHPAIAGKGQTLGDLVSPIVEDSDWECLK